MNLKISNAYKDFLNCANRYAVLYGGAGSGKSYVAAQKIILRTVSETPHKFLIVRKVARTLRESVFALLKSIIWDLGLEDIFKINETNMSFECLLNGNQIVLSGVDDPEKIKSIAGITGIWIEEATELQEKDFDQVDLRLRGETRHYKQIIVTFNPVSASHWIKRKFFDFTPPDTFILKTTYLDNPFVGDEYRQVMERLKRDNYDYYKIYALGEWGSLEGLIYPKYSTIDAMPSYFEKEYIGMDFGYNHPFAIVHARIDERNLYVDEIFYRTEMENRSVIEHIKKNNPWIKDIKIYADSARADLISEWKSEGFNIEKANKAVFEGINAVKSFNIHITKHSVNVIKEIGLYAWKKDKDGNMLDEPIKLNDDAMDAMRYALTPYISKKGSTKSMKIGLI